MNGCAAYIHTYITYYFRRMLHTDARGFAVRIGIVEWGRTAINGSACNHYLPARGLEQEDAKEKTKDPTNQAPKESHHEAVESNNTKH